MTQGAPRPDARRVEQHHGVRADLRCAPPSSATPISENLGLSPELLASWALRRVHQGGVVQSGDHYLDHGRLRLSYLTRTLDQLTAAGLLALAGEDPGGLRRVSLTKTGHAHYAQLTTRRLTPSVPEPELPAQTPAGHRSSCPDPLGAPGGQPDLDNTIAEIPSSDPRGSVPDIANWPPSAGSDAPCAAPGQPATSNPRQ